MIHPCVDDAAPLGLGVVVRGLAYYKDAAPTELADKPDSSKAGIERL